MLATVNEQGGVHRTHLPIGSIPKPSTHAWVAGPQTERLAVVLRDGVRSLLDRFVTAVLADRAHAREQAYANARHRLASEHAEGTVFPASRPLGLASNHSGLENPSLGSLSDRAGNPVRSARKGRAPSGRDT
jgi:hypothetical protein